MPELKNIFIRGKMNQDLDERLVRKGEYREGQNIQVSNSEDDDVGAIENVLGNKLAYTTGLSNVGDTCIGALVDTATDKIFWFTTNFEANSDANIISMPRARTDHKMGIHMKDGDNEPVTIVSGDFLNFNKKFLITGVNIIDNYLYWTDNYNQPRYIDLNIADPNGSAFVSGYYNSEEKISVAKIAPYSPPLLNQTNTGTTTGTAGDGTTLVRDADVKSDFMQDRFLRFAYRYKFKNGQFSIISPFTQNVFKPLNSGELKHARDQRNNTNADQGAGFNSGTNKEPDVPISTLDVVARAKVDIMQNAYNKIIMRLPIPRVDEFLGGVNPGSTYTNDFNIDKVQILLKESDGLAVKMVDEIQLDDSEVSFGSYYIPIADSTITVNGALNNVNSTTNKNLVFDTKATARINGSSQTGSTFTIDNISGTISIGDRMMAQNYQNTTQGSAVVKVTSISGTTIKFNTSGNFTLADNTILKFIPNVEIGWIIDNLSTSATGTEGYLYITDVKLTDGLAALPVLTMNKGITIADNSSLIVKQVYWRQHVQYEYNSEKPYKVLPEKQLLRVSDKTPVRAKAQEIVGNRLIYGNITQGYDLPLDSNNRKGIDYTIGDQVKSESEFNVNSGIFQHNKEIYKYHNLKQRRTYKVGIVLSDIYGRKSPVILSTHTASDSSDTFTTQPDVTNHSAGFGGAYSWSSNQTAIGKALAITFQGQHIVEDSKVYDKNTNPNGWYSYTVVVKQTEQDYYNIYAPYTAQSWSNQGTVETSVTEGGTVYKQIITGRPDTGTNGRSWLTLISDNINKVPRNVTEEFDFDRDGLVGSDVKLYPKVIPQDQAGTSIMGNINQEYLDIISMGTATEQGLFAGPEIELGQNSDGQLKAKKRIFPFVYKPSTDPVVVELPNLKIEPVDIDNIDVSLSTSSGPSIDKPFGFPGDPNIGVNESPAFSSLGLMVFETKPVESNLDIFYESSTSGLVKDLNTMLAAAGGVPTNIALVDDLDGLPVTGFPEAATSGTFIGNITATITTAQLTNVQILNAVDGNGNDIASKFIINQSGGNFQLKTNSTFIFSNQAGRDNFTITLKVTQTGGNTGTGDVTISVTNSSPSVTSGTGTIISGSGTGYRIGSVTAVNGTADSQNKSFITPVNVTNPIGGATINEIELSQSPNGTINILTSSSYTQSGFFGSGTLRNCTINIVDNGGLTASAAFNISLSNPVGIEGFAHATDPCSYMCTAMSVTYYGEQGTGSQPPTDGPAGAIYTNNILYIDAAKTTRLFAGTTGKFVHGNTNARWSVSNGVLTGADAICATC
jgi:hypothetical protein